MEYQIKAVHRRVHDYSRHMVVLEDVEHISDEIKKLAVPNCAIVTANQVLPCLSKIPAGPNKFGYNRQQLIKLLSDEVLDNEDSLHLDADMIVESKLEVPPKVSIDDKQCRGRFWLYPDMPPQVRQLWNEQWTINDYALLGFVPAVCYMPPGTGWWMQAKHQRAFRRSLFDRHGQHIVPLLAPLTAGTWSEYHLFGAWQSIRYYDPSSDYAVDGPTLPQVFTTSGRIDATDKLRARLRRAIGEDK